MKVVFVSDAWHPQVNGVVRTTATMKQKFEEMGHEVVMIEPSQFFAIRAWADVALCLNLWSVWFALAAVDADAFHIFTEGPLGLTARLYCQWKGFPFSTALTTYERQLGAQLMWPEYFNCWFHIPTSIGWRVMKWFHAPANAVLVANPTIKRELEEQHGFDNITLWTRGVDLDRFQPTQDKSFLDEHERPVYLYVGRVAAEKNLETFYDSTLPGTKVIVGDGPEREEWVKKYPAVKFVGAKHGAELAKYYACSDVFVFPSKTDTFGLVMIEAMASGLPVAAFPVTGPNEVVATSEAGVLDDDLEKAALACLKLKPEVARERATLFSWDRCAKVLEDSIKCIEGRSKTRTPISSATGSSGAIDLGGHTDKANGTVNGTANGTQERQTSL